MPFREIFRVLQGYRNYDPSKLDSAYKAVKEDKISVHGAAKRFGVPVTTLRDRVDGRIHIDCCTTGAPPLFTLDQEAAIFNHIKIMSEIGYGYTRSEVVDIASDYAIDLGLKERGNDLSLKWYYGFMKRWPELSCNMPSGLSELRARAVTPERIGRYFIELDTILEKYSLKDKPHLIYNVDEKGIITGGGKRPKIVTAQKRPQVVTSERSQTITVFGCGNAAGTQIPPYFVFPGKRMLSELLEGATVGADGTVSGTGYSNGTIFTHYVQNHFLKYVQCRDSTYEKALSPSNVRSAFKKSGIFPYNPNAVEIESTLPSLVFEGQKQTKSVENDSKDRSEKNDTLEIQEEVSTSKETSEQGELEITSKETSEQKLTETTTDFFNKRGGEVLKSFIVAKKARRNISFIIGGKAITEEDTFEKVKEYKEQSTKKTKASQKSKTASCDKNAKTRNVTQKQMKKGKVSKATNIVSDSQQPGPSGIININNSVELDENDEEIPEEEKCCICHKFEPESLKKKPYITFVNWAMCSNCTHWVHLSFCVPERVVRRDYKLLCPHCK
ncbi:hypothetical protein KUTeg_016364 [Tegillarca granosa]|uniref:HTH psq-type domain-containing protein n=1 Tax=Tegillarca granosa TaxID=220873 RepID=A0ABQ9ELN0_TEGGR|nr:hypothetical protein KUTeg_016364 [Tegillarca granosa]